MREKMFKEYCSGCGLCEQNGVAILKEEKNGLMFPDECTDDFRGFCEGICPASNRLVNSTSVWGNYIAYYSGYSKNEDVRKHASSGGVLTTICCWLLEKRCIDGIIQVKCDESNPIDTITVVSRTKEEVFSCAGSRYSRSSPLLGFKEILKEGEKYAFVGKPCDVYALTQYMEKHPELQDVIKYKFSFFCAGTPSVLANKRLLSEMGVEKPLRRLVYRGDGWPGFTKAEDVNGREYTMSYREAWMDILGRDIRLGCKFCFDSIGETSDISCGDLWYLDKDGNPDFSEHDGRNCIFTWTERGQELLELVKNSDELFAEEAEVDELKKIQPNHFNRRTTMISKVIVMKLFGRKIPRYSWKNLGALAHYSTLRAHFHAAKGTAVRIVKKKI